jgi:hypothetical protein
MMPADIARCYECDGIAKLSRADLGMQNRYGIAIRRQVAIAHFDPGDARRYLKSGLGQRPADNVVIVRKSGDQKWWRARKRKRQARRCLFQRRRFRNQSSEPTI